MDNNVFVNRKHHKGRVRQVPIYLGKFFRMFIYMDDWRVIPMAALIAGLVALVAGQNMFVSMEGTMTGSLAMTCICIWNGFFNSIQVVCRERDIVKREHRGGMHVSSYVFAHMIYQAFLCFLQTITTIVVCLIAGMKFPFTGFITPFFYIDIAITIFLITYAADMTSLAISCLARTTTMAMTIMPFMLIFELLFSGKFFSIGKQAEVFSNLSIAKWGLKCFNAQANYNSLPMNTIWNQLVKFDNFEIEGIRPINKITTYVYQNNLRDDFLYWCGQNQQIDGYSCTIHNICDCWVTLIIFIVVFALLSILFLEFIDKDKR